jgi:hypothetical protein
MAGEPISVIALKEPMDDSLSWAIRLEELIIMVNRLVSKRMLLRIRVNFDAEGKKKIRDDSFLN